MTKIGSSIRKPTLRAQHILQILSNSPESRGHITRTIYAGAKPNGFHAHDLLKALVLLGWIEDLGKNTHGSVVHQITDEGRKQAGMPVGAFDQSFYEFFKTNEQMIAALTDTKTKQFNDNLRGRSAEERKEVITTIAAIT